MEEKELCLFLDTLAKDITKHFSTERNSTFYRYYIIDGVHYSVTVRECSYITKYRFEIVGAWVNGGYTYKSSKPYVMDSEYISSLFVELPKLIYAILRELNSCY
jgi:hypothetical protein